MPAFYTHNRIFLSNDRYAIAYAIKDSDEELVDNSIIRIINKKNDELINEIKIKGEVKDLCFIASKELLAVATEGSHQIFIYDLNENKLIKTCTIENNIGKLLASQYFLIASAKGSLYFFDVNTFDNNDSLKLGDAIGAMVVSDHAIICDVWKKEESISQVMMYDSHGVLIRHLGEPRIAGKIRSSFIGLLDNNTLFIAIPEERLCNIFIYQLETGKQLNKIIMQNNNQLYICPLRNGGIAISQEDELTTNPNLRPKIISTVSVIHDPLEQKMPFFPSFPKSIDSHFMLRLREKVILRSQEDMILFISNKERNNLSPLIEGITTVLKKMGMFAKPIEHLITAYSVPSQALEEKEIEQLICKIYP
jgi:hypothetical protein